VGPSQEIALFGEGEETNFILGSVVRFSRAIHIKVAWLTSHHGNVTSSLIYFYAKSTHTCCDFHFIAYIRCLYFFSRPTTSSEDTWFTMNNPVVAKNLILRKEHWYQPIFK